MYYHGGKVLSIFPPLVNEAKSHLQWNPLLFPLHLQPYITDYNNFVNTSFILSLVFKGIIWSNITTGALMKNLKIRSKTCNLLGFKGVPINYN
jgi:hypothetical protein